MTIMEFSMIPLDKGARFSAFVARILSLVDQSGLEYQLTPMGTIVEGDWDQLLALLTICFQELQKDSDRISLQVKFDYRRGPAGRLQNKVQSVQAKAGRPLKTSFNS
jgi:uncharacterized protein (TIGR00106 family)